MTTARTVPPVPVFTFGMELTSAFLGEISTWMTFWQNPPMFRMTQQIAQSIASGTWTQVTCDTPDYDSDGGRGAGTPYSYIIPPGMTGRWRFGWQVPWVNNAAGTRNCGIRRNGTAISSYTTGAPVATTGAGGLGWSDIFAVNAGDSMSMWAYQSSGGALSTSVASDTYPVFWGRLESLATP